MNLKNKKVILISLTVLLVSVLTMNLTGGFSALLPTTNRDIYSDPITIDFITIQSLIKAVSMTEIPAKTFIEAIDSLNQATNVSRVRSPFTSRSKRTSRVQPARKKTFTTPTKRIIQKRPKLTVNGIIWDESNPYAILNGEIYRVGDELKGYTIQAIMDTMVVFSSPEDEFSITYKRE